MADRSAPKARGVCLGPGFLGRRNFRRGANGFETDSILLLVDELAEPRKQLSRSSAARLHDDPAAPTTLVHPLFDQRAGARRLFVGAKAVAPIERADAGFRADLGDDRADQALVQEFVSVLLRLDRRLGVPLRRDFALDLLARRQQFRRDIFGLDAGLRVAFAMNKADAAGAHHVEKQLLVRSRVIAPDQRFEQRAGETAAEPSQLVIALGPVKDGINGVESPGLIEDDPVLENVRAVEHDSGAMQIIEQKFGLALEFGLRANLAKLGLGQCAMTPLAARQLGVCGAHGLELRLDAMARDADRRDALALAQIGDGFRDFLDEVCATAVGRGAEMHQRVAAEGLLDDLLRNRANVVVLGPVTTRLHDRHGSVAPAEVPNVVDPIAKRLIAENEAVAFVL